MSEKVRNLLIQLVRAHEDDADDGRRLLAIYRRIERAAAPAELTYVHAVMDHHGIEV